MRWISYLTEQSIWINLVQSYVLTISKFSLLILTSFNYRGWFFIYWTIWFSHKIKDICTKLIIFAFKMTIHIDNTVPQSETCLICPPYWEMTWCSQMTFHSIACKVSMKIENTTCCIASFKSSTVWRLESNAWRLESNVWRLESNVLIFKISSWD
jgi:hypothetical protein